MKKGFTLIEMVVVVTLAAILLGTASISTSNIKERRALIEAKTKVAEILRLYAEKSFNEAEVYKINLDYDGKVIQVKDADDNIEEEIDLPGKLNYTTVEGGAKVSSKLATSTVYGGMTSFSVYIFDKKEDAKYRVAVDGINVSRMSYINVYKNKSASVTWSDVATYSFNSSEWELE